MIMIQVPARNQAKIIAAAIMMKKLAQLQLEMFTPMYLQIRPGSSPTVKTYDKFQELQARDP